EFHKELAMLQRELNRLTELKGKAFMNYTEAREEREQLSRFAPRKHVEAANLLCTRRETEAALAEQECGKIQQVMNRKRLVDLQPLMEKLNELLAEEMKLANTVSGTSYTNEYGIVVPARK